MKIGVIGSRNFDDNWFVNIEYVYGILNKEPNITMIISGDAKGADKIAEKYADSNNLTKFIIRPNWDKYGIKAGFIRNSTIIKYSDKIYAFWDGKSNGTRDSIKKAKLANKEIVVIKVPDKIEEIVTQSELPFDL